MDEAPLSGEALQMLLVEDDEGTAALVMRLLSPYDVDITAVSSLPEALDELADNQYEVVFSDLGLGATEGAEVIRHLRAEAPEVPLVAYSSSVGGPLSHLLMERVHDEDVILMTSPEADVGVWALQTMCVLMGEARRTRGRWARMEMRMLALTTSVETALTHQAGAPSVQVVQPPGVGAGLLSALDLSGVSATVRGAIVLALALTLLVLALALALRFGLDPGVVGDAVRSQI